MATQQNGTSVLGEGTSITGRVTGDGDLEIRGRIDGEVEIRGDLVIAEGALIRASLSGARVTVRGAVLGDVIGTEAVVLEATARVVGDLRAPRIAIALGAQIRGELDMGDVGEPERRAAPATASRPQPRAAQPARPAQRAPTPPARPAIVARKTPPAGPAAQQQAAAPAPSNGAPAAPAAPAPPARKGPPEPVVPAIKKGAKAAPKSKKA
jgi:cytoskeletal protein CcmA (bactofilin family)